MTKATSTFLNGVLSKPLFADPESPMHRRVHHIEQPAASPLVLVVGENASGKSLLRRTVQEVAKAQGVGFLDLSMELRCEDPWLRAESYGDEEVMSTGMISIRAMSRFLDHDRQTTVPGDTTRYVIFWDEPDIGLSDETAAGVGWELLNHVVNSPATLVGFFLVTHRRALLETLCTGRHHVVYVGSEKSAPKTLTSWLSRKVVPRSPSSVVEEGVERFKAVSEYLNRSKKGSGRERAG